MPSQSGKPKSGAVVPEKVGASEGPAGATSDSQPLRGAGQPPGGVTSDPPLKPAGRRWCRCRRGRDGGEGGELGGLKGLETQLFKELKEELDGRLRSLNMTLSLEDEECTLRERLTYQIEKFMSWNDAALFILLFIMLLFLVLLLGAVWYLSHAMHDPSLLDADDGSGARRLKASPGGDDDEGDEDAPLSFVYCLFVAFQVILSAGFDDNIVGWVESLTYMCMILVGLIVLGLLIGMITEAFESLVESIRSGEMKAVERDHTLVLGWNEGTVRLICQLAFVRRQWRVLNETWERRILWWRRIPPSTDVAKGTIVVMCKSKQKAEMEEAIKHAFAERGISKRRTRLGCDVICRVGDPSDVQDLQRVGAHRANAVVLQAPNGLDAEKAQGATLRALMALRFVMYTSTSPPPWDKLRVVVEMSEASKVVSTAAFCSPKDDRAVVHVQDLSVFLNGLLFACVGQPGVAQVLLELMSFDSAAIKFRSAREFPNRGEGLVGSTFREASLLWEDAVLLGIRPDGEWQAASYDEDGRISGLSGLLPDPQRRIQERDTILFLCASSMPRPAARRLDPTAPPGGSSEIARRPSRQLKAQGASRELQLLVCGWRPEWDYNSRSLYSVLDDIANDVSGGMHMHFLWPREEGVDDFIAAAFSRVVEYTRANPECQLRLSEDASRPNTWRGVRGRAQVVIERVDGRPESFEDLERLVTRVGFDQAVLIPPRRAEDVSEDSATEQDTWMMSVLLMLKHFQKKLGLRPIHVIAENALDATSKLAMCPTGHAMPDFVNSQAITARALSQVLAYPDMASVLRDLFSKASADPNILLVSVEVLCLVDEAGRGLDLTFGELTRHVFQLLPADGKPPDAVLGWRTFDGQLALPPQQSERHTFARGDNVVIVTNRAISSELYRDALFGEAPKVLSKELPKELT